MINYLKKTNNLTSKNTSYELTIEVPETLYQQIKAIPNWQDKLTEALPELLNRWKATQQIEQISLPEQLESAFQHGLIEVFQTCFAEPPYYQYHNDSDVREYFEEYRTLGVLYIAWKDAQVVGFTASLPLTCASIFDAEMTINNKPSRFDRGFLRTTSSRFASHLAEPEQIQYVADLGVKKDYRNKGIGKQLLQSLLDHFPPETPWVLRVLEELQHTQSFYHKFGFTAMPLIQSVKYLHQDQTYHFNNRLILAKKT